MNGFTVKLNDIGANLGFIVDGGITVDVKVHEMPGYVASRDVDNTEHVNKIPLLNIHEFECTYNEERYSYPGMVDLHLGKTARFILPNGSIICVSYGVCADDCNNHYIGIREIKSYNNDFILTKKICD